jgi:acetolactate synthase-1/2/3 large subunit
MHGTLAANNLVPEADVLLIVGARLSDRTTGAVKSFAPNAKIIHLDIDRSEVDKNVETVTRVVGDASLALRGLLYNVGKLRVGGPVNSGWKSRVDELKCVVNGNGNNIKSGYLRAPEVIKTLREVMPRDGIVTTEVGQNQMWAALHYDTYEPRTFMTSGGLGTMGWGFPASIGAKAACPDKPVVDIAGDGSFGMTENSLATSVEEELPVVVLILNNNMLGMVAQWQRLFFGHRYSAVELKGNPDFVKLADAYGAQGVRVDSLEKLRSELRRAIKADVSTVIDVPVDPEENVYPIVPPGMGLRDALMEV